MHANRPTRRYVRALTWRQFGGPALATGSEKS